MTYFSEKFRIEQEIGELRKHIDDISAQLQNLAECQVNTREDGLLFEALDLLEQATFHDGRYGWGYDGKWQRAAQELVEKIAGTLNRIPYEDYNQ